MHGLSSKWGVNVSSIEEKITANVIVKHVHHERIPNYSKVMLLSTISRCLAQRFVKCFFIADK
jgi:hypothetical protein